MAYFRVNPTNTDAGGGSKSIAIASSGNRARFIAIGYSNAGVTTSILRIYDGTAATGTIRLEITLAAGQHFYNIIGNQAGHSLFPKIWFTSGNAIECDLDGAGDVRVFGEIVREA